MPRCLSEGVDIFLKSAAAVSLFNRKFTPGDATSRRDVPFAVGVLHFGSMQKKRVVRY